ncbi:MAG: DUF4339 domain-containing protein, partial [Planctomycetia bacterium]|nr:DUF4339 domain-containing protein [Planctomycetia bacterium]
MSAEAKYFVRRQGRVEGPWPIDKLRAEVKLRKLGRYHELSLDGAIWQRATEVQGLFEKASVRKVVGGATQPVQTEAAQPNSKDAAVWYCVNGDEQSGPMTLAELGKWVTEGRVMLDDLVWQDGYPDWIPAERVPELAPFLGGDRSGSYGTNTEATRLVQSSSSLAGSKFALASAVVAGMIAILSCVPVVGLLCIVPVVMG